MDRQIPRDILDNYKNQQPYYSPDSDKYENLERSVKFLMEQIGNFEKVLYTESKRNKSYFEHEKDHIDRVETSLKMYEDRLSLGNSDLANKISLLEGRLLREEKAKIEMREKVIFLLVLVKL